MMVQRSDAWKIGIFYDLASESHFVVFWSIFFAVCLFCELWFSLVYITYLVFFVGAFPFPRAYVAYRNTTIGMLLCFKEIAD